MIYYFLFKAFDYDAFAVGSKGDDVFCKRKDSPADEDCPVAWQVEDLRLKKSLPTIAVLRDVMWGGVLVNTNGRVYGTTVRPG